MKEIEKELALLLIENVENKQMNLTYKETAEQLGARLGVKINPHYGLRKPLEAVARICAELDLPIITVRVVHGSGTTSQMAGAGFYKIACELKPQYGSMTEIEIWESEKKLVRECKEWQKLRDFVMCNV